MGLTLKWMAMQGGGRDLLLDHLGFAPIGEASDELNASYACCELPGGWQVFAAPGHGFPIEDALEDLPQEALVLAAETYETVMFSSLRGYQGGGPLWSVVHDPDKDARGLAVEGQPPAPFDDLKRELEPKQATEEEDVDHMFDLPGRLGGSLCGYVPGQTEGIVWTVLAAAGSRVQPAGQSITGAIRSELTPYLQSRGWEPAKDLSDISKRGKMVRQVGEQIQTVFFGFMSGPQTYIQTIFETQGKRLSGEGHPLRGVVDCARVPHRGGKWQGFFKPRLPAPDPIDEAIERAKADILLVEEFLKTDVRAPGIQFYRQWEHDAAGNPRPVTEASDT